MKHSNHLEINELLYSLIDIAKSDDAEQAFYYSVSQKFTRIFDVVKNADEFAMEDFLNSEGSFMGPCTLKRFSNFYNKLCREYLSILSEYYCGDIYASVNMLRHMMDYHDFIRKYLDEPLENYLSTNISDLLNKEKQYWRVVDFDKDIKPNCWHVPYEMRSKCSPARFSLPLYPCLYLSDSLETAQLEIGNCPAHKVRYYSNFRKKEGSKLMFVDLTIPTKEDIAQMNDYTKFCLLLKIPLFILCLSHVPQEESDYSSHEQYIFPQLLLHVVLREDTMLGISYSSTKKSGGINYVIPAKYTSKEPPHDGYSPILKNVLEEIDCCKELQTNPL